MIKIVLLSHITADNIGDQMIELCASSLIRAVMKNLGINEYELKSVDAGFVNNRYLSVQEMEQPEITERLFQEADLVIFGGAPMFNYKYEGFLERTVKTLNIIKKYSKPVLFSSIGVEDYQEDNQKCIKLRESLGYEGVKMITTRDNYDALQRLTKDLDINIAKVSDPAVFTFGGFPSIEEKRKKLFKDKNRKKKIGIFSIRGGAFKDNRIDFSQKQLIDLWNGLVKALEEQGYDYEFLTSGSHADEAFLERLTVEFGIDGSKCVTNLNTPEDLVEKIGSYDAIIACRLHPSIIAYSLKVPAVGLVWNDKVTEFYRSIGYPERAISVEDINVDNLIKKLETVISEGTDQDPEYLMSCYEHLFKGIKCVLCPQKRTQPFLYDELVKNIPEYRGSDLQEKINWKFARLYRTFNKNLVVSRKRDMENKEKDEEIKRLQEEYKGLEEKYNILKNKLSEITEIIKI